MLAPKIKKYIERLTEKSPEIEAIWLIGSRANGNAKSCSDWDLLVFGDINTFNRVKTDISFHCDEIDLLIVIGDEFSKPYGNPKAGSLQQWKWEIKWGNDATYNGTKWIPDLEAESEGMSNMGQFIEQTLKAVKVY
ncbi:nucleotidyltransferase domain-containing protein [Vibrio breoganii]|uniref:nucleotidyltransferase domain-containing protein n=1 Tax=Vibrio breoganii TaxID=553239 RepID=UPI0021C376CF|nr:nucleotidyltransferase domain-containing protein [Vibrio breoganii]MDN3716973.1 nucleotidyltransferase domain-containing protein [Vibrio breoganii]